MNIDDQIISGFDMVNEEDFTPGTLEFVKTIKECQKNQKFPVILHGKI